MRKSCIYITVSLVLVVIIESLIRGSSVGVVGA
jgi:hypothetical protein